MAPRNGEDDALILPPKPRPVSIAEACGRCRSSLARSHCSGRALSGCQERAAARDAFLLHFPWQCPRDRCDYRTRANRLAAFATNPPKPASHSYCGGVAALLCGKSSPPVCACCRCLIFPSPAGVLQSLVNDRALLFDSTWHSLILLLERLRAGCASPA